MRRRASDTAGFSLIEMAIVLIIIGAVAVILVPTLLSTTQRSREQRAREQVESLRRSIVGYVLNDAGRELPPADDAMFNRRDPWGRQFDYYPARNAGGDSIEVDCNALDLNLLEVQTPLETIQNVAFVIRSTGQDFNNANFSLDDNDTPNDTSDDVFVADSPPGGGTFPDDHYAYMTYYQLARVVCRDKTLP